MDWKTEQEWLIIRYFREYYSAFPKGRLTKSESPDFKLWISPGTFIGIELTRIHPVNHLDPGSACLNKRYAWNQIMKTLANKEEKSAIYLKKNPQSLWLIIFADYSEAHAIDRISRSMFRSHLATSFLCVFFFDLDQHFIIKIK